MTLSPQITCIIPSKGDPLLKNCLQSLLWAQPNMHTLVVETATRSASEENIEFHHCPHLHSRAAALNFGATQASTPYLLFLHADCQLPKFNFAQLPLNEETTYVFKKKYTPSNGWLRVQQTVLNFLLKRFSVCYVGTHGLLLPKKNFEALHGFKNMDFLEDVEFMRRYKKKYTFQTLDHCLLVSSRKYKPTVKTMIKNVCIYVLYFFNVSEKTLKKLYA